jgi:phytoene dehydrogenase-like protein
LLGTGLSFLILEASDGLGGRVRTDKVDGFLLDRGFQVLQTAYPEAKRILDYAALELKPFYPGALVRFEGRFHRITDPFRRPQDSIKTVISPIGTFMDKLRVARFRQKVRRGSLANLFRRPETSSMEKLRAEGFSDSMINCFFRPFFGGVFLEAKLETSSRMLEFVFRMFAEGDTALPAGGMGAIADQLASALPNEAVRLGARVEGLQQGKVILNSGEELRGKAIVVATEGIEAARLLGDGAKIASRSTTCLYFSAQEPPIAEPILVLNGEGTGPVTSISVLSEVAPSYAVPGKSLISVTVLGNPRKDNAQVENEVRGQLRDWFGPGVDHWHHLRSYRIEYALPAQLPPVKDPALNPPQLRPGLFVCGEYRNSPSIQWAMVSGRCAAEAIIEKLKGS